MSTARSDLKSEGDGGNGDNETTKKNNIPKTNEVGIPASPRVNLGGFQSDSTSFTEMTLVEAIEKVFDSKFAKLQTRLSKIEEKNERISQFLLEDDGKASGKAHKQLTELVNIRFAEISSKLPFPHHAASEFSENRTTDVNMLPSAKMEREDNLMADRIEIIEEKLDCVLHKLDGAEAKRIELANNMLETFGALEFKVTGIESHVEQIKREQSVLHDKQKEQICVSPSPVFMEPSFEEWKNSIDEKLDKLPLEIGALEMKSLAPKLTALQTNLDVMLTGETEANDLIDKLIPMVTTMQKNVELILKQQDSDFHKLKDDILYKIQKAVDDTYAKASDAKVNTLDILNCSEDLLEKVSKVNKVFNEKDTTSGLPISKSGQKRSVDGDQEKSCDQHKPTLERIEIGVEKVIKDLRRQIDVGEVLDLLQEQVLPGILDMRRSVEAISCSGSCGKQQQQQLVQRGNSVERSKGRSYLQQHNKGDESSKNKETRSRKRWFRDGTSPKSTHTSGSVTTKYGEVKHWERWTYDENSIADHSASEDERESRKVRMLRASSVSTSRSRSRSRSKSRSRSRSRRGSPDIPSSDCDKKRKIGGKRKKNRASSRSDLSSDDDDNDRDVIAMEKQLSKICSYVQDVKDKMDSWLKYSKRTILKSDENTDTLIEKLTSMAKAVEISTTQERKMHDSLFARIDALDEKILEHCFELKEAKDQDQKKEQNSFPEVQLEKIKGKLNDFGSVFESLSVEQFKQLEQLNTQVRKVSEAELAKMDDLMLKLKATLKMTNAYEKTSLGMVVLLKNVEKLVLEGVGKKASDITPMKQELLLAVMNELQPKMDDMYIRVIPLLEEISNGQRKSVEREALEEKEVSVRLGKILDLVQDIKEKGVVSQESIATKLKDPRSASGNEIMQVFNALNDLKNQFQNRDQTICKTLSDMKGENNKITIRLNEILKTKSTEKSVCKIQQTLEEMKKDSLNDMKTLSTINTMLQGSKASDAKMATQLKDVKEWINKSESYFDCIKTNQMTCLRESKTVQKEGFEEMKALLLLVSKTQQKIVDDGPSLPGPASKKRPSVCLDEPTLNKILNGVQKRISEFLGPKSSLLEELDKIHKEQSYLLNEMKDEIRDEIADVAKSRNLGVGIGEDQLEKLFKESLDSLANKMVDEMVKRNGEASEILNSVEDLKQLTSSTPNAVHEILPKIDKIINDVAKIPTDVAQCTAALEENMCKNLETTIRDIQQRALKDIGRHFEVIDQRLAVIKKYAKHGPGGTVSYPPSLSGESNATEVVAPTLQNVSFEVNQVISHVSKECKLLADGLAKTVKGLLSAEYAFHVKDKLLPTLNEVCSLEHQIIQEQAKAVVVEDQLEALVNTVLQPIQEIKPSQERLIGVIEKHGPTPELLSALSRMEDQQKECLDILGELKSISDAAISHDQVAIMGNQAALQSVKSLIGHLKGVQRAQKDLMKQGDRCISYQTAANDLFSQIVPTLEVIQKALEDRSSLNLDSGSLPSLCDNLKAKIAALGELESKLLATPRSQSSEDVRELVQMCVTVMDRLLKDTFASSSASSPASIEQHNILAESRLKPETSGAADDYTLRQYAKRSGVFPEVAADPIVSGFKRRSERSSSAESSTKQRVSIHLERKSSQWGPKRSRPTYVDEGPAVKVTDDLMLSANKLSEDEAMKTLAFQPEVRVEEMGIPFSSSTVNITAIVQKSKDKQGVKKASK